MASDNDSSVYRQLNVFDLLDKDGDADISQFMKIPSKDLRQAIELVEDASPEGVPYGITQLFSTSAEPKGSVVRVEDINRAQLQIVDSNHKIYSILKALYGRQSSERLVRVGRLKRNDDGGYGDDSDDEGGYWGPDRMIWNTNNWPRQDHRLLGRMGRLFLEWPTYSHTKKCVLFSHYSCHELNFFLFKKDREFFDKVVRDLIKNKMEKTFVDKYLLGLSQDS